MNPCLKPYSLPCQYSRCCFQGLTAQPADRPSGGGGDASSSTPNRAKVLEIAIEVLRAAEYEIKSIDKNKGHVRATKGSVDFTLTCLDQLKPKPCAVRWTIGQKLSPRNTRHPEQDSVLRRLSPEARKCARHRLKMWSLDRQKCSTQAYRSSKKNPRAKFPGTGVFRFSQVSKRLTTE